MEAVQLSLFDMMTAALPTVAVCCMDGSRVELCRFERLVWLAHFRPENLRPAARTAGVHRLAEYTVRYAAWEDHSPAPELALCGGTEQ